MKNFIARSGLVGLLSLSIVGCATTYEQYEQVEAQDGYPGRVVDKAKIRNPNLEAELEEAENNYHNSLFLFGVGSVIGGAIGGAMMGASIGVNGYDKVEVPDMSYRYTIETEDEKIVVILNKHSGFTVGDCVMILVGQQTGEVLMAYGGECTKAPSTYESSSRQ
ncbi:MAG: hypothetical protein MI754_02990 [Chromatiales bacterium]|nr:hypothetical protein [Chromatiales bacterium]